jgi:hypothetical protein
MKTLNACVTSFLLGASLFVANGVAHANKVDTLTGQTPGHLIGCDYTFKNGDPSIPCAQDFVAADGTVSFIKPNAPFDNIEYFDFTAGKPLAAFFNPINVPINSTFVAGTQYPILRSGNDLSTATFFDVFFEIDLQTFDSANLQLPGAFEVGDLLNFVSGANTDGFNSISIPGFTGTGIVVGFDLVSVPEPSTLLLLLLGSGLVGLATLRRGSGQAWKREEEGVI